MLLFLVVAMMSPESLKKTFLYKIRKRVEEINTIALSFLSQ